MLKLIQITVFSLVVSAGAFSNNEETDLIHSADIEMSLNENNSDQFLDIIGKAFDAVKNIGKSVLGTIKNIFIPGGSIDCDAIKKQIDPDKKMSGAEEKDALDALSKSSECTSKNECDPSALKEVMKKCY